MLSIVIPTNRPVFLKTQIERLSGNGIQTIVVSDVFHDEIAEICSNKPDVRHVINEGSKQYAARRTGLKYVTTPKVLLFDDDDVVSTDVLKRVLPKTVGYDMTLGMPMAFLNHEDFLTVHLHYMDWSELLNISGIIFDTVKIRDIHNIYDFDEETHNEDFWVALKLYQDGCTVNMLPEFNYIKWNSGLKPWTKVFRKHVMDLWLDTLSQEDRHHEDPLIEFYFSRRKYKANLWIPTIKSK